ncbi:sulfite exporter TauE/SafE family protein [Candidatus Methylospira mobilis]|uniref:Probable membrane transporter protein n=2 Tax=Candidatus Methylospira mobilis TaxID=1808979 RepID=A0A5Q0BMR4_9GAMM|nr:sulfite exporter TauE/SafE family protein [Candidatus Methylospira mobilis]
MYPAYGALAGLFAGLFGIGGGAWLVPVMVWDFSRRGFPPDQIMIMAVATSLATIIITSLSSVYAHHRHGAIRWRIVGLLAPGMLLGSVLGSLIADHLPAVWFKSFFALFLIIIALRMFSTGAEQDRGHWNPSRWLLFLSGALIGSISSLVGIGGGSLSVPLLNKCNYPLRNAVAISSACGFPIAIAGTASYIALGMQKHDLPPGSWGYIFAPAFIGIVITSVFFAPVGAKLAHILPVACLKKLFALMLLAVGCKMLWIAAYPSI